MDCKIITIDGNEKACLVRSQFVVNVLKFNRN
jgi:hypothetical protein